VNDHDLVVFPVLTNSGVWAVYTGGPGRPLQPFVTDSGPYKNFLSASVNNSGAIAFNATLDSGVVGVFTGPDPQSNKVIAVGDPLFGSTVQSVFLSNTAINNSCQIAFVAMLANGNRVVVRATPGRLPDLAVTSLAFNAAQGGVDFGYTISGADLSTPTTVGLYWSADDHFDKGQDRNAFVNGPIATQTAQTTRGPVLLHVDRSDLTAPPPDAKYLLAVIDPDNTVAESDETNNVLPSAYSPAETVTAKYDGDPDPATIGRFFTAPNVLTDETFTIQLSDSLAALRPDVVTVTVGSMLTLPAHPKKGLLGSWDGRTYETDNFDPGTLDQSTPLHVAAIRGSSTLVEDDATLSVQPLPDWVMALRGWNVSFDRNGSGPGAGAYVFDGFLPDLSIGGTIFTVPKDVPLIGGQTVGGHVGFEVRAIAPLSVASTPTWEAGLQADLTLGTASLPIVILPPRVSGDDDQWSLTVKPGGTLDPVTLTEPGGFSLTVGYDSKVATPLEKMLFDEQAFVLPFGIPVELEFTVAAALDVMLHAHAHFAVDPLLGAELLPDETYFGLGVKGDLSAKAQGGWFPPAWVQNFLNMRRGGSFSVVTFALRDTMAVEISADAEAHVAASLGQISFSGAQFKGDASVSNTLDLIFQIGNTTIFDLVLIEARKKLFDWSYP
jgi:hypothetical protein